jgi:hypothetical protein
MHAIFRLYIDIIDKDFKWFAPLLAFKGVFFIYMSVDCFSVLLQYTVHNSKIVLEIIALPFFPFSPAGNVQRAKNICQREKNTQLFR